MGSLFSRGSPPPDESEQHTKVPNVNPNENSNNEENEENVNKTGGGK